LTTTEQRKDKRTGPVYLDVMRNAYAQTVVAPYVVRARPGAHVATPLEWDEVADSKLTPGRFTLRTVRRRLGEAGSADPWAGLARRRQGLAQAQARLDELAEG
ncbi:MAG TPA: ATP-dependent DNA ligase, partial [Streptosporangiaceae bacterium]